MHRLPGWSDKNDRVGLRTLLSWPMAEAFQIIFAWIDRQDLKQEALQAQRNRRSGRMEHLAPDGKDLPSRAVTSVTIQGVE